MAATSLIVAATAAAGWRPYVDPPQSQPSAADAIIVLGGAHDGREEYGLQLAEQGYAPRLIFSDPYGESGIGAYGNPDYMVELCNSTHERYTVSCFTPNPSTTRGEGREIRRLADENHWTRVLVVTFRPHVERSRYILDKCWDGDITVLESPTELPWWGWVWNYVYQTAGFVRAAFEDC